jgi:release factor glutamine methyltransferase
MLEVPADWASGSPSAGLGLERLPLFNRLLGKAMRVSYRLIGKARYDAFRLEWVQGSPFIVTPSVFNPKVPRTGEFLASLIGSQLSVGDAAVLDMGTGSGVCAVLAARYARRVLAIDINVAAVRCAGINARLNGVEDRVEVRHGDLFAPAANERFDLILFNPPFLRGVPRDDRDRAWRSSDIAERFAAGLAAHLKPGGCALVVLSTFGNPHVFLEQFERHQLRISVAAKRRFVNERLAALRLMPDELPSDGAPDA